ncbi:MAG: hypothetical protein PHC62_00930 [Candidatus Izemoplasmatales bacterium]|nr:hypothetical protein [Candidatus Izemoplasmatales bacterium]
MDNFDMSIALFEFDMRSIEIEQDIMKEMAKERYMNEASDDVNDPAVGLQKIVIKVFASIVKLLDKFIMNARKAFQNVGLKQVKDKMKAIRKSSGEAKEVDGELRIPSIKLLDKSDISQFSTNDVGYSRKGNTFQYSIGTDFHKAVSDGKRASATEFGYSYFMSKALNVSDNGSETKSGDIVGEYLKSETKTIKIDKNNCRNHTGAVETSLDEIDKYMESKFKECINQLLKMKQEANKLSMIESISIPAGGLDYVAKRMSRMSVIYYQSVIRYATQYLFKSTAYCISCAKHNVSLLSQALL